MKPVRKTLDSLTWPATVVGLAAVAVHNWRQWQRDKALLARLEEPAPLPPLDGWPALPLVSVLVAAWNEADFIEKHIESFLTLRYPNKELVLCAGGPDGTYEKATNYGGKQVIVLEQKEGEGKQRALARAFPLCKGAITFLTDADCLLDDEAFEQTVYPVANGQELVTTGGSRPIASLLSNPLVVAQAASDLYLYRDVNAPAYLPGLLGRNCAIQREVLEQTSALSAPAPTGTDYVLAKELVKANVAIRQIRASQIATRYPTDARSYLRQRRRWLRNVALYGTKYGAMSEVWSAVRPSLVGLAMLVWPLAAVLLGPRLMLLWIVVFSQGLLARMRYLGFASKKLNQNFGQSQFLYQALYLALDLVAWTLPILDYFSPRRRGVW